LNKVESETKQKEIDAQTEEKGEAKHKEAELIAQREKEKDEFELQTFQLELDSIGANFMGAIAPTLQNLWRRRHYFCPTGFWSVGVMAFLVYFVFVNVCLVC